MSSQLGQEDFLVGRRIVVDELDRSRLGVSSKDQGQGRLVLEDADLLELLAWIVVEEVSPVDQVVISHPGLGGDSVS